MSSAKLICCMPAGRRSRRSPARSPTLRDALLPQLMSGRLRVRDAEKIVEDAV